MRMRWKYDLILVSFIKSSLLNLSWWHGFVEFNRKFDQLHNICLTEHFHFSSSDDTRSGEAVWLWRYSATEAEVHDLVIEKGDRIRFRVVEEVWRDTLPTSDPNDPCQAARQPDMRPQEERVTPYSIIVSC